MAPNDADGRTGRIQKDAVEWTSIPPRIDLGCVNTEQSGLLAQALKIL